MIYIGEGIELNYLSASRKYNLEDKINEEIFTVKDTPLSYRQINSLDEDDLLNKTRKNKKGWRKFSLKELVYISILEELKKYGLQHSQLKELSNLFLKRDYSYLINLAIGCVLGQIEITIQINSDGKTDIFDPNYYVLLNTNQPHIQLCLNDFVNSVFEKVGRKTFPIEWSIKKSYEWKEVVPKEEELLKILRDKNYTTVTVKKKNGEISVVYAQKAKPETEQLSESELIKLLKAKDFQDISIVKRDGKIVSHTVTETIRL